MTMVPNEERCRAVIHAALPRLPTHTVRFLGAGWDSSAFVDDERVFRFPMRAEVDASLLVESRLLPELADSLPLPVPCFDVFAEPTAIFPWHFAGYRLLPGTPLAELSPEVVPVDALTNALAPFLTALHRFPVTHAIDLGVPVFSPARWVQRHRQLYEESRAMIAAELPSPLARRFSADLEGGMADPAFERFVPSLIHGDLSEEHLLVSVDTGGTCTITGVIDFGDAMIADPALDYAGLTERVARQLAVLTGVDADPGFWRRVDLYHRAGPLHAIEAGQRLGRRDLVDIGLRQLRDRFSSE